MEMYSATATHLAGAADERLHRAEEKVTRLETQVAALEAQIARMENERAALWWAVGHDDLTGLANRRLFYSVAPSILSRCDRAAAVIVLDLNDFKPINDTFGHEVGDDVLRHIARRLARHAGSDLVARLGGDEFAAVLTQPLEEASANWWRATAAALAAVLAEPIPITGRVVTVTASIGVAPAGRRTPIEELVRRADVAMYQAKATLPDASAIADAGRGDAFFGYQQPVTRPRHACRDTLPTHPAAAHL
jgi:diguanylate cyclase (GGDEF)-like protein